ncbi:MAG: hypothetical protein WD490_07225 [Opitutales bacterium]
MTRRNLQSKLARTLANLLHFWAEATRHHADTVERIARRVDRKPAEAGNEGEERASTARPTSESASRTSDRPGGPPTHWLKRIRESGPSAHWLKRVRESGIQEDFQRFESPGAPQSSSAASEQPATASSVPADPSGEPAPRHDAVYPQPPRAVSHGGSTVLAEPSCGVLDGRADLEPGRGGRRGDQRT